MKYLKKFEGFIVPKGLRKSIWKDEDIALEVLVELESPNWKLEEINKLYIKKIEGDAFKFEMDEFKFKVKYGVVLGPAGARTLGYLKIGDKYLNVSTEVCKKIKKSINKLKEMEDSTKSDFRKSRGLIK